MIPWANMDSDSTNENEKKKRKVTFRSLNQYKIKHLGKITQGQTVILYGKGRMSQKVKPGA